MLYQPNAQTEKLKKKQDEEAYENPEKATEAKNLGNEAFKATDYPTAVKVRCCG